jgi:hypothetical protein
LQLAFFPRNWFDCFAGIFPGRQPVGVRSELVEACASGLIVAARYLRLSIDHHSIRRYFAAFCAAHDFFLLTTFMQCEIIDKDASDSIHATSTVIIHQTIVVVMCKLWDTL